MRELDRKCRGKHGFLGDYAFGVRYEVFRRFHKEPGFVLRATDLLPNPPLVDLSSEMLKSTFCFCPSGTGWGMRVFHAAALGCIPVIMQQDAKRAFPPVLQVESPRNLRPCPTPAAPQRKEHTQNSRPRTSLTCQAAPPTHNRKPTPTSYSHQPHASAGLRRPAARLGRFHRPTRPAIDPAPPRHPPRARCRHESPARQARGPRAGMDAAHVARGPPARRGAHAA